MIRPSKIQMQRLLTFLEGQSTELRPAIRWLMLGRDMAESLMVEEFAQEPSLDQLLQLMRILQGAEPDLVDTATLLTASSRHAEALHVEVQLDGLVDRDPGTWNHPVQLLARPRSPWGVLLAACQRRSEKAEGTARERLRTVEKKLERAIELDERARRKRQQMQAAALMEASLDDVEVN